jgi:hypothetical protein
VYRPLLHALTHTATCGVVVRNRHKRITFINEGASQLMRLPRSEFHGVSPVRNAGVRLLDASGAEVDWSESPFEIATQTKQPVIDHQYGLRFANNEIRRHVGTYVPLLRADGSISRVIAFYVDDSPRPDCEDISTRLRATAERVREHGSWLREDALQTLLGISLTLQRHLADQVTAGKTRDDVEFAVAALHEVAEKVRHAAAEFRRIED